MFIGAKNSRSTRLLRNVREPVLVRRCVALRMGVLEERHAGGRPRYMNRYTGSSHKTMNAHQPIAEREPDDEGNLPARR